MVAVGWVMFGCAGLGFLAGTSLMALVWMRSILNRLRKQGLLEPHIRQGFEVLRRDDVAAAAPELRRVATVAVGAGLLAMVLPPAVIVSLGYLNQ